MIERLRIFRKSVAEPITGWAPSIRVLEGIRRVERIGIAVEEPCIALVVSGDRINAETSSDSGVAIALNTLTRCDFGPRVPAALDASRRTSVTFP